MLACQNVVKVWVIIAIASGFYYFNNYALEKYL